MSEHIFVYGTLRRGGPNHDWLASAPFVGPARTAAPCALYVDGYPYLNPNHPIGPVHGEVFAVDPELLPRLDEFEGVPVLYERTQLLVDVLGEGVLHAWTYIRDARTGILLEHGDYAQR